MPSTIEAFEGALMADAAYVDFPTSSLSGGDLEAALTSGDPPRFTAAQAAYFASRFELVDFSSVGGASFQAAIFRDLAQRCGRISWEGRAALSWLH